MIIIMIITIIVVILIIFIIEIIIKIIIWGSVRPSNERHPGSERGLQRVCAPLRYVSSGAKLEQIMANSPSSRIKRIHRDVVPEFRVLAAENWPTPRDLSRTENWKCSLWVREIWRSEWKSSLWVREEKKETLDRWWPAVYQSCTQIQCFISFFLRHWAPTPAPEPSPGLRLCRGIAAALPARNSRAPARLLEAAELLEADQRKLDGGQCKMMMKKKKKKKKIKIERSTSGTIYAQCTLPDRPPTAAN